MEVQSVAQTQNTQSSTQNNTAQSNSKFSNFLNTEISSMKINGTLPSDAMEQLQKNYKEDMTDKKFDQLLDTLSIKNLTNKEKEFYKSIIDDRVITKDEIKDLSYEEIVTLNKFIDKTNEDGTRIKETSMLMYVDASQIINIPLISNNEAFNKSVLEMTKGMDDTRQFITLVRGINEKRIDYDTVDPSQVLNKLIYEYKDRLETSTATNDMKYYQGVINIYSKLLQTYEELSGENITQEKTETMKVDITQILLEDLLSLIKTGLTESERKELEKLIATINKLIDDSEKSDMIEKLKLQLEELQKRMGDNATEEFKSMVSSFNKILENIEEDKSINKHSTSDELKLIEQIKNNN